MSDAPDVMERMATVEAGQRATNTVLENVADELSRLGDRISQIARPNFVALSVAMTFITFMAGAIYVLTVQPINVMLHDHESQIEHLVDQQHDELEYQRDRLQSLLDHQTYGTPTAAPRVP